MDAKIVYDSERQEKKIELPCDREKILTLLSAYILISVMSKLLYFMKVSEQLGLMSALLLGVF